MIARCPDDAEGAPAAAVNVCPECLTLRPAGGGWMSAVIVDKQLLNGKSWGIGMEDK